MNQLVTIHQQQVERLCYREQPIVTLKMVDHLHERPDGTAKRNFYENRERFIAGEDYFEVPYQEWTQILTDPTNEAQEMPENGTNSDMKNFVPPESSRKGGHRRSMFFLTESGYLLLVKSLTDDLAWQIQRELVSAYFRVKPPVQPQAQLAEADPEPPGKKKQHGLYHTRDHVYSKQTKDHVLDNLWETINEKKQAIALQQKYIALLEEKVQCLEQERSQPAA